MRSGDLQASCWRTPKTSVWRTEGMKLEEKNKPKHRKPTFHQPSSKLVPVRVVQGFDPQNDATI
ncbi:hypothetical protein EYF80_003793 [Liparis tanakae]|uniref:Uncharacterized protein n=1 Tax=Liparis tanakae TaxID=230148 RepID=A0A4Z2J6Y0_9TELE|nr:hypothetical protein EYF80_003793 [Liparis tanakae]